MKNKPILSPTAKYVKAAREFAGLTQPQLGEMLACGKQNVSAWENDRHTPSPMQLAKIARETKFALPEELSPSFGNAGACDDIPRSRMADVAATGVASVLELAGVGGSMTECMEEIRRGISEGRQPRIYSPEQILAAISQMRTSDPAALADTITNGRMFERILFATLSGEDILNEAGDGFSDLHKPGTGETQDGTKKK